MSLNLQRKIMFFLLLKHPHVVAGSLHVQVVMEMLQFPPPFPVPRRLVSEHFFHDYLQYNQCQAYRSAYFGVKISHNITGSIRASSISL